MSYPLLTDDLSDPLTILINERNAALNERDEARKQRDEARKLAEEWRACCKKGSYTGGGVVWPCEPLPWEEK